MRATFDPNDEALICAAWEKCNQEGAEALNNVELEAALAIVVARTGFQRRLLEMFPEGPPINDDGEFVINICDPETFFDLFVVRLEIQAVCDRTGRGVALGRSIAHKGRSPDVVFTFVPAR